LEKPLQVTAQTPTPVTLATCQHHGADNLAAYAVTIAELKEGIDMHAFGFEATVLFCQSVTLWFTLQILYRARQPMWSNALMIVVVASLAKYIIVRLITDYWWTAKFAEHPKQRSTREKMSDYARVSVIIIGALYFLLFFLHNGVWKLATTHAPATLVYIIGPLAFSQLIFGVPVPPLPDLWRRSLESTGTNSSGKDSLGGSKPTSLSPAPPTKEDEVAPLTPDLASMCARVVLYRTFEGCYLTTVVPLILHVDDKHAHYDAKQLLGVGALTGATSLALLLAQTLMLNRLQLYLECKRVGCWAKRHDLGSSSSSSSTAPDDATSDGGGNGNGGSDGGAIQAWKPWGEEALSGGGDGGSGVGGDNGGGGCLSHFGGGYPRGALVAYQGATWEAVGNGPFTRCVPGGLIWTALARSYLRFEGAPPRSSLLLLSCALVLLAVALLELLLLAFRSQWVPIAALLLGSVTGMVRRFPFFFEFTHTYTRARFEIHVMMVCLCLFRQALLNAIAVGTVTNTTKPGISGAEGAETAD
jgi:hypothetical protein